MLTFPTALDTGRISITSVNSVTAPERRYDQSTTIKPHKKDRPFFFLNCANTRRFDEYKFCRFRFPNICLCKFLDAWLHKWIKTALSYCTTVHSMTSADYKEDPTLAVISFSLSNCKLFISWAKWISLVPSRMYRMFTIRRRSKFYACYLGHPNCSPVNTPKLPPHPISRILHEKTLSVQWAR